MIQLLVVSRLAHALIVQIVQPLSFDFASRRSGRALRSNRLNDWNGLYVLNGHNSSNLHYFTLGVSIGKSARSPHSFQEPM